MKQLYQNLRTGETAVADVPLPVTRPGTVLVRTQASLVSAGTERTLVEFAEKSLLGKARSRPDLVKQVLDKARREGLLTTLDSAFNRLDQPMPLGYSSAGTIVKVDAGVQGFRAGQRVACAGGGYAVHAEYCVVPQNLLALLPDNVDFESGAFTTLGAIALHGFRLAEPQLGERVAVIGLGLLGFLATGISYAAGCQVLGIDLDPDRVDLAEKIGVKAIRRENAEEAAQGLSNGFGFDTVLICADSPSADPVELAGAIARDRARVVAIGAVGLNIPRKIYYEKELFFVNSRSYGPGRYDPSYEEGGQDYPIGYVRWTEGRNLQGFVDLLANNRVDVRPLITHRFPIERAPSAYELITGKWNEFSLGVLLTYPDQTEDKSTLPDFDKKIVISEIDEIKPAEPQSCRLGILGAGNFASAVLLPILKKLPGVELVGIASGSGLSARHAADRFNIQRAASEEAEIINDPGINTIAVLTRHNLHARQVLAALNAGKHVFCEKPMAISAADLEEITYFLARPVRTANASKNPFSANPLLIVGFNRRFAPLANELKGFIDQRKEPLAAHYRVNAGHLPSTHWLHDPNLGGGRVIGEGCHFVDFLTFMVGDPPVSVVTRALPDNERYHEDNLVMTFTFPDGSIGTIHYLANGDPTFPKERIEVFASGRVAVLDDFRSLELVHNGRRKVNRTRLHQDKGHRSIWEAYISAITNNGSPPIPYNHLVGVTQATFSAVEALRSEEKVIIHIP